MGAIRIISKSSRTLVFNQLRSGFEAHSDSSLSACIKQGQHLAISGVSGCGKGSLRHK
ncbi:hypothetical protein [Photobacterium leiognathi]|uniref:hypothetical protein n=1 Tax=Photobacterium leiognathi TaxID=553611 RepID=UPI002733D894|nr:hypothetical protein [Photobacterium leiognathi]